MCYSCYYSDISPNKMDHKLYLEVLDYDRLVRNDVIGRMAIPIREIIEQKY